MIKSLEINNYSPTMVSIVAVKFDAIQYYGPRIQIGVNGDKPDTIEMPINHIMSKSDEGMIVILKSSGGFPPNPVLDIHIPSATSLSPGCSFVP